MLANRGAFAFYAPNPPLIVLTNSAAFALHALTPLPVVLANRATFALHASTAPSAVLAHYPALGAFCLRATLESKHVLRRASILRVCARVVMQ